MKDEKITQLYITDPQKAAEIAMEKYGEACQSLALGLLKSPELASQTALNACQAAKKSIEKKQPRSLQLLLLRLTRLLSLRQASQDSLKQYVTLSGELSFCLETEKGSTEALPEGFFTAFLKLLSKDEQTAFIRRYWYFSTIDEISALISLDDSQVKAALSSALRQLKSFVSQKCPDISLSGDDLLFALGKLPDSFLISSDAPTEKEKVIKEKKPVKESKAFSAKKLIIAAVIVVVVALGGIFSFGEIKAAVKAAPSAAPVALFETQRDGSEIADDYYVELYIDCERSYAQVPREEYALYGIDEESLSKEDFGEKIGKIRIATGSSDPDVKIFSRDLALEDCKAYYYAPAQGEGLIIVKGNDCCSVFAFIGFIAGDHSLNDIFLVFDGNTAEDIESLSYSSSAATGETFYRNYIDSFYTIMQSVTNVMTAEGEKVRDRIFLDPTFTKVTVKLKNGLFFETTYVSSGDEGGFLDYEPVSAADHSRLATIFCLAPNGVSAPNAGLFDTTDMARVFSKNEIKKIAPASLTKIITACVALEYASKDEVFTVGSELELVMPNSSVCLISKGHRLTLYDLLTGMLVKSGNDAAYTIAVNIARIASGDKDMSDKQAIKHFCSLMNDFAEKAGAVNSNFENPDGWDGKNHYTTIKDLALICAEAIKHPEICEIVKIDTKHVVFESGESITWSNTNLLLNKESSYYMPEAVGMKTGTTPDAGNCLIALADINSKKYIAIVTGCETNEGRYESMHRLLELV